MDWDYAPSLSKPMIFGNCKNPQKTLRIPAGFFQILRIPAMLKQNKPPWYKEAAFDRWTFAYAIGCMKWSDLLNKKEPSNSG
jgi:hypothetical protein